MYFNIGNEVKECQCEIFVLEYNFHETVQSGTAFCYFQIVQLCRNAVIMMIRIVVGHVTLCSGGGWSSQGALRIRYKGSHYWLRLSSHDTPQQKETLSVK